MNPEERREAFRRAREAGLEPPYTVATMRQTPDGRLERIETIVLDASDAPKADGILQIDRLPAV